MKKLLILFFLVFLYAEVDPFKAGDLNSPSPYGLTPTEEVILKNKKEIEKNSLLIKNLQENLKKIKSKITQKFIEYDDKISNLQTKYTAFNALLDELDATKLKIDKLNRKLKDINLTTLNNKITALEKENEILKKENETLKKAFEEFVKIQNKNLKALNNSIEEILKELKELKSKQKPLNPKQAFIKAKAYFFGNQLEKAKELFLYTLDNNYLPATSAYYLGEIAFKQKNYKKAIFYYKRSTTIYPKKASFTPVLLYHSGLSFLKLNQKEKAKLTFQKLINDFPNSKFAKLAKKELEKL